MREAANNGGRLSVSVFVINAVSGILCGNGLLLKCCDNGVLGMTLNWFHLRIINYEATFQLLCVPGGHC